MQAEIGGIIRTLLAAMLGALAAKGFITADDVQTYSSAIAVLAIGGWSIYQKRKTKK